MYVCVCTYEYINMQIHTNSYRIRIRGRIRIRDRIRNSLKSRIRIRDRIPKKIIPDPQHWFTVAVPDGQFLCRVTQWPQYFLACHDSPYPDRHQNDADPQHWKNWCCGSGSTFIWLSWIRIRIQEHGNWSQKIYWFPAFQKGFCTFVGVFTYYLFLSIFFM